MNNRPDSGDLFSACSFGQGFSGVPMSSATAKRELIRSRMREIPHLSTLPQVMTRIMAVLNDEDSSAKDLAKEVRADQAMTSKILKVSNSAYYGFYRKISNIEEAIVVLGHQEIRSLSLAITVLSLYNENNEISYDRRQFWRHCVTTAVLADMMAKNHKNIIAQAFTAGLLHDIGRTVLDQFFPDEWKAIYERAREKDVHWMEVEHDLIDTDHAEIGYWLAEQWNFPPVLSEAIRWHHQPGQATESPLLTGIIHLSDILSRRFIPVTIGKPALDETVYSHVPLSRDGLEALSSRFEEKRAGVEALTNVLLAL
jgi:putative nucleotidyltransferase with HDIG domain